MSTPNLNIRTSFTNPKTAAEYEYTGGWESNGKEKRIAWPKAKFDGLVCEMTPEQVQRFIDLKDARFKKKTAADKPLKPAADK